jgi:phage terminase small subunit
MGGRHGLNPNQKRFVDEYLIDRNATQAAIRAGYCKGTKNKKSPQTVAHDLLRLPWVIEEIDKKQARIAQKLEITSENIAREYARIAFANFADFGKWGGGNFDLTDSDSLTEDQTRAVQEVSQTVTRDGGSITIKLHDKKGALDSLAKHLGMFVDKIEHSGSLNILPPKIVMSLDPITQPDQEIVEDPTNNNDSSERS